MPLLEVLQGAAAYLEKQEVEQARLNAEHLLAHVLNIKRLELYLQFDRPLSETERAPLRNLVRQRGAGRPLQQLLGTVEFCGRTFRSDPRALIPRPETEQLVERALTYAPPQDILDVATGSGVIAISLAIGFPKARVKATDISNDALLLATENASLLNVNTVCFEKADLFPTDSLCYDLITANLPYIPTDEISMLDREVAHDPILALNGGSDGLELIGRFVSMALSHLNPDGRILMEIGHDQDLRVIKLLSEHNYRDILSFRDYQGIPRFIEAVKGRTAESL